jgi:hypothetical protein
MLTGEKKRLHELAFPANRHAREPLEPLPLGHLRFSIEPRREQRQLSSWNLSTLDAIEQMLKEGRREVLTADFRHVGF